MTVFVVVALFVLVLLLCLEVLMQLRKKEAGQPGYYRDLEESARYARTLLRNGAAAHALRELDAALKD